MNEKHYFLIQNSVSAIFIQLPLAERRIALDAMVWAQEMLETPDPKQEDEDATSKP